MASKKKNVVVEEPLDEPVENFPVEKSEDNKCGHTNYHSIGPDGKFDHPVCEKKAGHSGDHQGRHMENQRRERVEILNGVERTQSILVPVERVVQWGDMAGTPTDDIPAPPPVKQPSLQDLEDRMNQLEKNA